MSTTTAKRTKKPAHSQTDAKTIKLANELQDTFSECREAGNATAQEFWVAVDKLVNHAAEKYGGQVQTLAAPIVRLVDAIDRLATERAYFDESGVSFDPPMSFWQALEAVFVFRVQITDQKPRDVETIVEIVKETGDYEHAARMWGWYHEGPNGPDRNRPNTDWVRQELDKPGSISKTNPPPTPKVREDEYRPSDRMAEVHRLKKAASKKKGDVEACQETSLQLWIEVGPSGLEHAAKMLQVDVGELQEQWLAYEEEYGKREDLSEDRAKHLIALDRANAMEPDTGSPEPWAEFSDPQLAKICEEHGIGVADPQNRAAMIAKLNVAGAEPPPPEEEPNGSPEST